MQRLIIPVCLLCGIALTACGGSGGSGTTTSPFTGSTGGTVGTSRDCPTAVREGASAGITALPANATAQYKNNFCKYTKLVAPNGKAIHFYAQNRITNEQLVRARNILAFYLTSVPGSQYGLNKTAVFNQMANNNATLILPNGSDTGTAPADGQTLYETENVVEGSAAYLVNNPRDAAFEEILHLMHDTGFGVDGANTRPGVLPAYQREIRRAMNNAAPAIISAGGRGIWASNDINWLRELARENSLTQEYLASVIDTYYGLAGQSSHGGSNALYKPQTRAQIKTMDPRGWALVGNTSPRKFFNEFVTYEARVDAGFRGTFSLTFDPKVRYTHKSQYLTRAILTGTATVNLRGNDQNNQLTGNAGNNVITGEAGNDVIDGGAGSDTAKFSGVSTQYTITKRNSTVTVKDKVSNRDGTDTVRNIELLQFTDTAFSP